MNWTVDTVPVAEELAHSPGKAEADPIKAGGRRPAAIAKPTKPECTHLSDLDANPRFLLFLLNWAAAHPARSQRSDNAEANRRPRNEWRGIL